MPLAAKYEDKPSHAKSIHTCTKKRKAIPNGYPNNSIESDINFIPTVIHQRKKNGLTPVNMIPARIGF